MAGSLGYSLKVANVYQRRFDSESFATALAGSHLYIISRRPALRIDRESVRVYEHQITFNVVTKKLIRSSSEQHSLVLNFEPGLEVEDFRTYSNDTYFSFRANGFLVHGDAWALASLASNAGTDLATQEVLYVGQAYGDGGSSNSWQRTRRHSTLQRIYEDHSGEDWGIFISPLVIVKSERSSEDHIDDEEEATVNILGLSHDDAFYDRRHRLILPTSIDLIEHALIAHFAPPYNELLKEWRPDRPTIAMSKMKSAGFRLLQIHLDGWQGLARYYTKQIEQDRSHLVLLATENDLHGDGGRIICNPSAHNWRLELVIMHYRELLTAAETSTAVLNIFGDEAPRIRRPPEVTLPDREPAWSLDKAKEEYAALSEVIEYKGPEFDPVTGLVSIGTYADGQRCHWQLVRPGQGVCHGMIAGAQGTGKTNALNILRTEALCSGLFGPLIMIDPTGRHDFTVWRNCSFAEAYSLDSATKLLTAIASAVVARREAGNYELSASTPGVLVTLENAHVIFNQSSLAVREADIIARFGDSVGVSLVATMPDLNIARFGNRHSLRTALRRYNTIALGPPDIYEMLTGEDDQGQHSASPSS